MLRLYGVTGFPDRHVPAPARLKYTSGQHSHSRQPTLPDDIDSFIDKKRTLLGATATFVYLVAVSLIILVVWSVWQTRVQTIAESKSTTTNMARALAQHAQDAIRSADNLLVGMAELVEEQRHLRDTGAHG